MSSIGSGSSNSPDLNSRVKDLNEETAKAQGAAANAAAIDPNAKLANQPAALQGSDDGVSGVSGIKTPQLQQLDGVDTDALKVSSAAERAAPGPAMPPDAGVDQVASADSNSFGANMSTATNIATQGGSSIDNTNSEDLMSAYLKLQVLDPNESMETKTLNVEAGHIARQEGNKAARQGIKNAQERVKEAEKEGGMLGGLGGIIEMLLQPLLDLLGMGKEEEKDGAKNQLRNAETYLQQVVGQNPLSKDRAKIEAAMQESFAKMREETVAGEDGVPKKGLAKDAKPKLDQVVGAMMETQGQDGDAAMLASMPAAMAKELNPMLIDAGVADPDAVIRELATNFVYEVVKIPPTGLGAETADQVPGLDSAVNTAILANALDKEPATGSATNTPDLASAAMLDGAAALMKESSATTDQPTSITG